MPINNQDGIVRDPPVVAPPPPVVPPMLESGVVITNENGESIITFSSAKSDKPKVFLTADYDKIVAMITEWITDVGGRYTGCKIKAYSVLNNPIKSFDSVIRTISFSTASVISSITKSTLSILRDISTESTTVVSSIPSTTGDAHGRYTIDAQGYIHHDHAIPSPSTVSVIRSISKLTDTVLSDISSTSTNVISTISTASTDIIKDVSLEILPAANVSVFYLVID